MRLTNIILITAALALAPSVAFAQKSRTSMDVCTGNGDCPSSGKSRDQIDRENREDRARNEQYRSNVTPCYGQNCTTSAR